MKWFGLLNTSCTMQNSGLPTANSQLWQEMQGPLLMPKKVHQLVKDGIGLTEGIYQCIPRFRSCLGCITCNVKVALISVGIFGITCDPSHKPVHSLLVKLGCLTVETGACAMLLFWHCGAYTVCLWMHWVGQQSLGHSAVGPSNTCVAVKTLDKVLGRAQHGTF